jgi:hypothetical protein
MINGQKANFRYQIQSIQRKKMKMDRGREESVLPKHAEPKALLSNEIFGTLSADFLLTKHQVIS